MCVHNRTIQHSITYFYPHLTSFRAWVPKCSALPESVLAPKSTLTSHIKSTQASWRSQQNSINVERRIFSKQTSWVCGWSTPVHLTRNLTTWRKAKVNLPVFLLLASRVVCSLAYISPLPSEQTYQSSPCFTTWKIFVSPPESVYVSTPRKIETVILSTYTSANLGSQITEKALTDCDWQILSSATHRSRQNLGFNTVCEERPKPQTVVWSRCA